MVSARSQRYRAPDRFLGPIRPSRVLVAIARLYAPRGSPAGKASPRASPKKRARPPKTEESGAPDTPDGAAARWSSGSSIKASPPKAEQELPKFEPRATLAYYNCIGGGFGKRESALWGHNRQNNVSLLHDSAQTFNILHAGSRRAGAA